ncbi:MAG: restriction endonuclease subunit S [Candidatus Sedimenticola sp. 4PFRAG1]
MSYKRLGDLVKVKGGKRLPKGSKLQTTGNSHPYIRVRDMGERYIPRVGLEFVPDEVFPKISRYIVNTNDLIISIVGTIGLVSIIDAYFDGASQTENCAKLTGLDAVDVNFLYYYLNSEKGKQEIREGTVGAVQAKLPLYNIEKIEVYWPDRKEREHVVQILSAIDDKSEVNTQTNQTLEQIAQAIFKSWFVDFEPVKAKMAVLEAGGTAEQAELAAMSAISAKDEAALKQLQAEQPDAYAELEQTAALFPSAMEESELGEIPAGWDLSYLKSCTTELRRGISPKYTEEGGVRVINQKCIRNHTVDFTLARRNDPSKRKIEGREIEVGDVLVNSTGVGTLGRLAPVRYLDETTVVDSHVTVVRADPGKISKSFLSGLMIVNESFIEASGAGSTGQTELRKQVLEDIRFARPSPEIDSKYDLIVNHMSSQIAELEKQRSTLASTRDSLLPKLLSGDLPITNTEVA